MDLSKLVKALLIALVLLLQVGRQRGIWRECVRRSPSKAAVCFIYKAQGRPRQLHQAKVCLKSIINGCCLAGSVQRH